MFKRVIFILAILAFSAVGAQAASHFDGKIATISGDTLAVTAHFDKVSWVKTGQQVKLNKKIKGVIISAKDTVLKVVVKKAKDLKGLKVGDKITVKKSRKIMSGC